MNGGTNYRRTRRSFFGHAGAALAAPLAAVASPAPSAGDDLAARLATLEDSNAIRALLTALLVDPKRLGLGASVRSLAADRDEAIAIAPDDSATVRLACTVETGTPIENCGTLVEMARLQGDGVLKRSERGVLTGTFVKREGT
ncbi:MAG TPA: hypothetical protein VNA66_02795, partial [Gammaproteobacteria bacterium]|nr:hypothetical protein [Gammaproteobacteria bacterium]